MIKYHSSQFRLSLFIKLVDILKTQFPRAREDLVLGDDHSSLQKDDKSFTFKMQNAQLRSSREFHGTQRTHTGWNKKHREQWIQVKRLVNNSFAIFIKWKLCHSCEDRSFFSKGSHLFLTFQKHTEIHFCFFFY